MTSSLARLLSLAALTALVGCTTQASVQTQPCKGDDDCADGQVCGGGVCTKAPTLGCTEDTDCDWAQAGETCDDGTCTVPPTDAPENCSETRDCPVSDFCNVATQHCELLHEGFCRIDSQCDGATPACFVAEPGRPGQCVECVDDGDCSGSATCTNNACGDPPADAPVVCGAHQTAVPGIGTCRCDSGFTMNADGTACEAAAPPPADPPPSDPPPATPPPASDPPPPSCPAHSSPDPSDPANFCICDSGYSASGNQCVPEPQCGANSQPDPNDSQYCICDQGYVVNQQQNGCEDQCAANGWYNDGICDFCPDFDFDCL